MDSPVAPVSLLQDLRFARIAGWLVDAGERALDAGEVLAGLAQRLVTQGVPLSRISIHIQAIHSERIGTSRVWRRDGSLDEQHYGFSVMQDHRYDRSVIRRVHDTRNWVAIWPQREGDEYNITADLRAEGVVHYLIGPLFFSDGEIQAASFSTDRPEGFTTEDQSLLQSLMPLFARILELKTLRRTLNEILRIYVGREPGARILSGQVRRGDVTALSAAMLFVDLRGFTLLSNEMADVPLVELLNRYFDCFVPPVAENGGEVLKFIGDAVLAIFPQPGGEAPQRPPRDAALSAAEEGLLRLDQLNATRRDARPLKAGVALHLGRVAYGNVGSVERQDFTVIGRDVNLVSRLSQLCARTDEALLLSSAFARGLGRPLRPLGPFRMKGFAERQRVFALDDLALRTAH